MIYGRYSFPMGFPKFSVRTHLEKLQHAQHILEKTECLEGVTQRFLLAAQNAQYLSQVAKRQKEICTAINKEKTVSVPCGMLTVIVLSLGIRRNRGQVAEVVILAAIRDGF